MFEFSLIFYRFVTSAPRYCNALSVSEQCFARFGKRTFSGLKPVKIANKIKLYSIGRCGHLYCYVCLIEVFKAELKEWVRCRTTRLPEELHEVPGVVTLAYAHGVRRWVGMPYYSCPTCRRVIVSQPHRVPCLSELAEALRREFGPEVSEVYDTGTFEAFFV